MSDGATNSTSASGTQHVWTVWHSPLERDDRVRGDVVADGVLVDVAILEFAHAFVPLAVIATADVRACDERLRRLDLKLSLEGEACVSQFIGCGTAMIDEENRNRSSAWRHHALRNSDSLDRPDEQREL